MHCITFASCRAFWRSLGHGALVASLMVLAATVTATAGAQAPKRPQNLQVLPKDISTDSVFTIMFGVADALGFSCGSCHPGGDNPTWDSTNFTGDVKPMKATAREMFRLTNRLNNELLPPIVNRGASAVPVTCATCHRGAPRPVTMVDTVSIVLSREGADSAIVEYKRLREQYVGGMAYDLTEFPLRAIAARLMREKRFAEAIKLLEFDVSLFPKSTELASALAKAYRTAGVKPPLSHGFYH